VVEVVEVVVVVVVLVGTVVVTLPVSAELLSMPAVWVAAELSWSLPPPPQAASAALVIAIERRRRVRSCFEVLIIFGFSG
jgi:hypothetical protein